MKRRWLTQIIHENLDRRFKGKDNQYHWLKAKTGKTNLHNMDNKELELVYKEMLESEKFKFRNN